MDTKTPSRREVYLDSCAEFSNRHIRKAREYSKQQDKIRSEERQAADRQQELQKAVKALMEAHGLTYDPSKVISAVCECEDGHFCDSCLSDLRK